MRSAACVLLAALGMAGCAGEEEKRSPSPKPEPRAGEGGRDERVIRAWSKALNAEDYDRAASYFARGAVVEQAAELRLPDRAAAEAFNRSLPCKAELTDVDPDGRGVLGAFKLRPGPGGAATCGGSARVRFVIEDGRFREWRQLGEQPSDPGDVI